MKNRISLEKRRQDLESQYPVWEKRTLYEQFIILERACGDAPFFIDSQIHSYLEVGKGIRRTIWCLKDQGVSVGDRVILTMGNRIEYIYITFALAAIGAVKVPVNHQLGIAELEYIVDQTDPKLLIAEHGQIAGRIRERVPCLKVICLEKEHEETLSWNQFFEVNTEKDYEDWDRDPNRVSDIIYTSGSTGNPKGVLLTHDKLLRSAYASCLNRGFTVGWRVYVPLPLYHVYGYVEGLLASMLVKGSIVISGGKYNAEAAIHTMEKWEVNDVLTVPFVMTGILKSEALKDSDLSSLQAVYCSASICPEWIWKGIRTRLSVNEITTGYGMTEVCGATVQTCPDDSDEILCHYLGKALTGGCAGTPGALITYRVIDPESGEDLPCGKAGELLCKGLVLSDGYLDRNGVDRHTFDQDGWFHTGDVGYFTEEGYLKLLGRIRDSYRINGENVSLHFLDEVIARCPDVAMVETVGIPDQKVGYVGAAFIEPATSGEAAKKRIREFCSQELAPYQIPAYFFFGTCEKWSGDSTVKIKKKQLTEMAVKLLERQK